MSDELTTDELTGEEALALIDALAFNGYVSNDTGESRRLYLVLPYTDWLPNELAQKFTRISERRRADRRRAAQEAELRDIRLKAKAWELTPPHEHGDNFTDCPHCMATQ